MQLLAKGQRKTANDGKGKKGGMLSDPKMENPKTLGAKKNVKQLKPSNGSRMF